MFPVCSIVIFLCFSADDTHFAQLLSINAYEATAYMFWSKIYIPIDITDQIKTIFDKNWSTEVLDCLDGGINPTVKLYVDRSVISYVNLLNSEGVYASKFS